MKKIVSMIALLLSVGFLGACEADEGIDSAVLNQQIQQARFTLEELALYDGIQQPTTYVAIDGIVYDVTEEFDQGMHQGMVLGGQDVSAMILSSPHLKSVLTELPIVGVLLNASTTSQSLESGLLPVFTLEELAAYDGLNGTTAYVAVNGVVYDVTDEWNNGQHQGMQLAGTDATTVFASSPHSEAFLARLQIIGSLAGAPTLDASTITPPSTFNSYDDYDDDNDNDNEDDYDDDYDDDSDSDDDYDDDDNDNDNDYDDDYDDDSDSDDDYDDDDNDNDNDNDNDDDYNDDNDND